MSKRFRVKELAQERNITQEELAVRVRQHTDTSISTIRRIWQNNKAGSPRGDTLLAIADVLGVSPKDLYEAEATDGPTAPFSRGVQGNKMSLAVQM